MQFKGLNLPERSKLQINATNERDIEKGYTKILLHQVAPHLSGIYKCFVEGNETIFDAVQVYIPGKNIC